MKIPNPYFKDVPGYGDLLLDQVIAEYDYPLLSVLKDTRHSRYICLCFDTRGSQQWLIAPITSKCLCELLTNQISMEASFRQCGVTVILVERSYATGKESFTEFVPKNIPAEYLPDVGVYLEAAREEWQGYIESLLREAV